ncbi:hypothetical protein SLE2022_311690 [Rubroshorea leprosula]
MTRDDGIRLGGMQKGKETSEELCTKLSISIKEDEMAKQDENDVAVEMDEYSLVGHLYEEICKDSGDSNAETCSNDVVKFGDTGSRR